MRVHYFANDTLLILLPFLLISVFTTPYELVFLQTYFFQNCLRHNASGFQYLFSDQSFQSFRQEMHVEMQYMYSFKTCSVKVLYFRTSFTSNIFHCFIILKTDYETKVLMYMMTQDVSFLYEYVSSDVTSQVSRSVGQCTTLLF